VSRGRASAASLAVVQGQGDRPPPPEGLTPEQRKLWVEITESMEPGWFRPETQPLLEVMVQYVARQRIVARELNEMEDSPGFNRNQWLHLLSHDMALTKAIADLSTKMRLTQQSTYDKSKRKPPVGKLWEG
jgi:hypothetical protein